MNIFDSFMINKHNVNGHIDSRKFYVSGSFAGLGFLGLYLSGKLRAFDRRGHAAKLCIVILPYLLAALVGVSRVDDYWHHWTDVFSGALLGLLFIKRINNSNIIQKYVKKVAYSLSC